MTADAGEKDFLRRWSRLKREARIQQTGDGDAQLQNTEARDQETRSSNAKARPEPSVAAAASVFERKDEAPVVQPIESLNLDSDYRPFFHPKVEEGLRRAALKKLFSDPHFNVMDGLDVYIEDYSKSDPLPDGMLEQLEQAKKIFAWSREDAEERAKAEARDAAAGVAATSSGSPPVLRDDVQPADAHPRAVDASGSATADINSAPHGE